MKKILLFTIPVVLFGTALALYLFYGRTTSKPIPADIVAAVITPTQTEDPSPSPSITAPTLTTHLSLDQIFNEDHSWLNELPTNSLTTVLITGDVLMARSVNAKNVAANDFTRPFRKTAETLKAADLTFINLETPLIPNCPTTNEGMVFCGDLRSVEGLTYAGIDIASLGNNHGGNHGAAGVEATVKALTEAGISSVGTTNSGPVYKAVDGQRFAFLGYNDVDKQPGVASATDALVAGQIKEAKSQADTVIVMFHWGAEYHAQPTDRQRQLGRLAIDAGADQIISNHPHWIQPLELYKNKPIAYALGNFVFDQTWSQKTQEGVVARLTYKEKSLIDIEYLPVAISTSGVPSFMTGTDKTKILSEMRGESKLLELKESGQ